MDTETVSVRIRKDTYSKVVALAEADFRPIVGMLEILLRDGIAMNSPAAAVAVPATAAAATDPEAQR